MLPTDGHTLRSRIWKWQHSDGLGGLSAGAELRPLQAPTGQAPAFRLTILAVQLLASRLQHSC